MGKKTVSLALGSGGARGLAHIGVIEVLEENGYEIRSIAGSSMGALVGGIYAMNQLDTYTEWVKGLKEFDVLKYFDITFKNNGLFDIDKVIKFLRELVGDTNIEDLPLTYTAVATDIEHQREMWINKGLVFDAIRASVGIPVIFAPFIYDDLILLDGGILNPVPIAPMMSDYNDLIIAVDVNANFKNNIPRVMDELTTISPDEDKKPNNLAEKIGHTVDHLTDKIMSSSEEKKRKRKTGFFEMFTQSIEVMQSSISTMKLAAYPPDIIIKISQDASEIHEFYRAAELIELGRETAQKTLLNNS